MNYWSSHKMKDSNKAEEFSFLLPFIGLFIFSPILLSIFSDKENFIGIPLVNIYIFVAWLILIAANYLLSTKLSNSTQQQQNVSSQITAHNQNIET